MTRFKTTGLALSALSALAFLSTSAFAVPFDQQFLDSMTPHHQMATEMAQMALQKAKSPAVKGLARSILSDQNREIAQMKLWRKSWFPRAAPMMSAAVNGAMNAPMSGMDHSKMGHSMPMKGMNMGKMNMGGTMMGLPMKMRMDMNKLAASKRFDSDFLRLMVPHHASAIVMAQEALDTSARPELRRLARGIIDSQAGEIGEMRALHRRLFGPL